MKTKIIDGIKVIVLCAFVATGAGCLSAAQWKTATKTFLSAADIACILGSALTDSDAVATACGIEARLKPAVLEALAGKAAAKQAGSCK